MTDPRTAPNADLHSLPLDAPEKADQLQTLGELSDELRAQLTASQKEVERLRGMWRDLERGCQIAIANGFPRVDASDMLNAARYALTGKRP